MRDCGIDGCQKRHSRLLHRSESSLKPITKATQTVEIHVSVGLNNFGILPVNEVELSNNGYRLEVLALNDSGSTLSWIDKSLSDQLDLHSMTQTHTVSSINGIKNMTELVQFTINTEECGSQKLQMAIHKYLVIGDSYDVQRMKRQYPQWANVPSKNICLKEVKVFLGIDCFSITRPLECQRRKSGEPWAVRSALGLTVSGSLPKRVVSILSSCQSSILTQNHTVSGINGIKNMTELVQVTINTEECGSQKLQMAIHKNLVIGDSYDVQRMKRQYPQWANVPSKNICLKEVKVFLGTDCFSITRPLEYQRRKSGEPWAVRSALGWTVSGSLPKRVVSILSSCQSSILQASEKDMNEQIKTWWDNECYGSRVKVDRRSRSDFKAMETSEKTTVCEDNRYTVGMLWSCPRSTLPNNYRSAVEQFLSPETRLFKNADLKTAYSDTMKTDEKFGYIRKLDRIEICGTRDDPQWCVPHPPVINPNKPGKVRRVCKAASEFEGFLLNKNLLVGPDLLQNLHRCYLPVPRKALRDECRYRSNVPAGESTCS